MRLLNKLLDALHSGFDKSPRQVIAFRLRHTSGDFRWQVQGDHLQGFDGPLALFDVDLRLHTIRSLTTWLAAQPGVEVRLGALESVDVSARCLLEGAGAMAKSNGDVVHAYTALLWSLTGAFVDALTDAKAAIDEMLAQMTVPTAAGNWLDEWGSYFGVPRLPTGELDERYATRIIAEVLRPRSTNKGMELALTARFGQTCKVEDYRLWTPGLPVHDGLAHHDGTYDYNAEANPIYGLFRVAIGYDLINGSDIGEFAAEVREAVEALRAVGTHMDSVSLRAGTISEAPIPLPTDSAVAIALLAALGEDAAPLPVDSGFAMAVAADLDAVESVDLPTDEGLQEEVTFTTRFNGQRRFDGKVPYAGGTTLAS